VVLAFVISGAAFASGEKEQESMEGGEADLSDATVEVLGGFNAAGNFDEAIQPFVDETGMTVNASDVESLASVVLQRVRAGDPPDLYVSPQPGLISDLVANDAGVPLVGSGAFSQSELEEVYTTDELALGQSSDGTQHALPIRSNLKSAIWYNPQMFDEYGYEIPETWEEMIALSDRMVENGHTPWCHALESGSASGWPGTDWIEDIVLHKDGPEVYDQWVNGEVGFSDSRIKEAFQMYLDVVRTEGYTFGGPTNAAATPFGEVGNGIFPDEEGEAPNCFMFKQAQFILSFVTDNNEGVEFGENINFFDFPTITPEYSETVLGAGVIMGMLEDSPAAREVLNYVTSADFQVQFARPNNNVAPNNNVEINEQNYPSPLARKAAESLETEGAIFRFDGSDQMPAAVGAGTFWSAILELVQGADLEPRLEKLDQDFADATSE
jgi:alpha-glucoside transport system substrate-binding protein